MTTDNQNPEIPYEKPNMQEKVLGKNVLHAPQQVTAPPAAPSWATGTTGAYLQATNTTELTAMYQTLLDIYNALLKEGLIKKK